MDVRPTKLAIIGAGAVGTAVAYASLIRGVARTVALMDINTSKVTAEVLDMSHGLEFIPRADIIGDDDVSVGTPNWSGLDVTDYSGPIPGRSGTLIAQVPLAESLTLPAAAEAYRIQFSTRISMVRWQPVPVRCSFPRGRHLLADGR